MIIAYVFDDVSMHGRWEAPFHLHLPSKHQSCCLHLQPSIIPFLYIHFYYDSAYIITSHHVMELTINPTCMHASFHPLNKLAMLEMVSAFGHVCYLIKFPSSKLIPFSLSKA